MLHTELNLGGAPQSVGLARDLFLFLRLFGKRTDPKFVGQVQLQFLAHCLQLK